MFDYQHSQFWPILARFMEYYSLFWRTLGCVYVSVVNTRSLSESGPFHELLLTVWGPRVISTVNEHRCAFMCRSSTLVVLADSDPFHGLLLTVLGPESITIVVEPQGALMCLSSTLAVFAAS